MNKFHSPSDIHTAVIGYGDAAIRRLDAMKAAGMTPVAIAEIQPERLSVAAKDFPGLETYSSVDDLLVKSQAELVMIVTPHNTHAPLAMKCLEAGRHVICEKPMALTTDECDSLIAMAGQRELMLSVFHNRHWDGCIIRAMEQINDKKVIGEIHRVETRICSYAMPADLWRNRQTLSGGILYDWGVHLLDYILQLMDSEVTEVSCFSRSGFWASDKSWKFDANEDEAFATIRFRNGCWATLMVSNLESNPKAGFMEITGSHGSYVMEDWNRYRLIYHNDGVRLEEEGDHYPAQFERYFENIAAHLTSGEPLVITPEWARRTVHILDLAGQSAKEGRALPARYP